MGVWVSGEGGEEEEEESELEECVLGGALV